MKTGYYHINNGLLELADEVVDDPDQQRLIILFSCGITSFIATLLALEENRRRWHLPVHIIYTYVVEEPDDNLRFLEAAEKYFNQKVLILVNEEYAGSIYNVFEQTGWLVGPGGARCTKELKWRVRKNFVTDNDVQVFGFNAGEEDRLDKFAEGNNDINVSCPLICMRYTKSDCIKMAHDLGIDIPASYGRGYTNANCIGCVKGQSGYWNHVRRVDPHIFNKMEIVERSMDVAINKKYIKYTPDSEAAINEHLRHDKKPDITPDRLGKNIRLRVFLDELDPEAGRYEPIDVPDCGVLCELEMGLVENS